MDGALKNYFDRSRAALPPELDGEVEGTLLADLARARRDPRFRQALFTEVPEGQVAENRGN